MWGGVGVGVVGSGAGLPRGMQEGRVGRGVVDVVVVVVVNARGYLGVVDNERRVVVSNEVRDDVWRVDCVVVGAVGRE